MALLQTHVSDAQQRVPTCVRCRQECPRYSLILPWILSGRALEFILRFTAVPTKNEAPRTKHLSPSPLLTSQPASPHTFPMRTPFSLFGIALLLLGLGVACHKDKPVEKPPTLSFYAVSAQPVAGGQLIDTPSLPKLGHIAAAPELKITRLEAVLPSSVPPRPPSLDKDGEVHSGSEGVPTLLLKLHAADLEKLNALVKEAKDHPLLVMLGDQPLMAPRADSLFKGKMILYPVPSNSNRSKVQDELEKMVK